jgi:RHS repeat-associated protein
LTGAWQDVGDTSAVSNPFTFQGRENDSEASLIYFRGRHLSPFQGRFIQRNPAGYAGGTNLYSAASLVNGRSPFGLDD